MTFFFRIINLSRREGVRISAKREVHPPKTPLTLKLTQTRGSESFIRRKCNQLYWASNICNLCFSPLTLRTMGRRGEGDGEYNIS